MAACSHSSSDGLDGTGGNAVSSDFGGNRQDVTGSITSQTGSQSQMQGWAVVLMERDNSTARVAEADAGGNLKFSKASLSAVQTVFLLSPDYLIQSVLSMPSPTVNTIRQYFTLNKNALPRIVQKGSVINFQSIDSINIQPDLASDADGDGVPDGMASLGLTNGNTKAGFALSTVDTDKDGLANEVDGDIDGDGLPNVIDSDDDGDGVFDVIDLDANGNNIPDSQERASDQHFPVGLEYIATQYIVSSSGTNLRFAAKVRDGVKVNSLKIRGAKSLLDGSTVVKTDGTAGGTWDLTLVDDGANDDAAAGDSIYGRTVTLATGKAPRSNQMVFFQLSMGDGTDAFTAEYPYTFAPLVPSIPTTSYDASTRTVSLAGDPLGSGVTGFVWIVTVKDSSGNTVYASPAIGGSTRTSVIPANIMQSGQTYTYRATAQTLDKVSGYPAIVVRSAESTINN